MALPHGNCFCFSLLSLITLALLLLLLPPSPFPLPSRCSLCPCPHVSLFLCLSVFSLAPVGLGTVLLVTYQQVHFRPKGDDAEIMELSMTPTPACAACCKAFAQLITVAAAQLSGDAASSFLHCAGLQFFDVVYIHLQRYEVRVDHRTCVCHVCVCHVCVCHVCVCHVCV